MHSFECRQAGTNSYIGFEECEGKFTIQIGIGGSNFNCRKKDDSEMTLCYGKYLYRNPKIGIKFSFRKIEWFS